jgi:VWFA-related protein
MTPLRGGQFLRGAAAVALLTAATVVLASGPSPRQAQQAQVPPGPQTFRSSTVLVPVDVRVLDKDGNPITDLKQEDFTVLENGVPQSIRHFSAQELAPDADPRSGRIPVVGSTAGSFAPQTNRIFLIMLGRGRLLEPSKGFDALLAFVRQRLLPQDQVAVSAYDRATDFSTNHAVAAAVLERYRVLHTGIEAKLAQRFSGLGAVYGSKGIPTGLQKEINQVFEPLEPAAQPPSVIPATGGDPNRLAADSRKAADATLDAVIQAEQAKLGVVSPVHTELERLQSEQFSDVGFEDFVTRNAGTTQDLGKIYTGIEYLRHFQGEKHLVFVTEGGLHFLRGDDADRLSRAANDARVAIDTFQTGGIIGGFLASDLRYLSRDTGGQASIMEYSIKGIDRLDRATRASYLLGYYAAKPLGDGKFRTITVKVTRPGTTVLYRRGYYAVPEPAPYDRRTFLTDNRVVSAAMYRGVMRDIGLTVKATEAKGKPGAPNDVLVEVTISATRVGFQRVNGTYDARLDVAVFFADTRGIVKQERWQQIDLKMSEDGHRRLLQNGITYTLRMPKQAGVRIVKVVVYDYAADLLGSTEVMLK